MQLAMLGFELPSWAFRRAAAGVHAAPATVMELLADAGAVHRFTGATPRVGLSVPDDFSVGESDVAAIARAASNVGVAIGTVSAAVNLGNGRPPGVCSADMWVRRRALAALRGTAGVLARLGARALVLRFRDDSHYPGRDEFEARKVRLFEAIYDVAGQLPPHTKLIVEFRAKYYGFAGAPGWDTMRDLCVAADERACVLVDAASDAENVLDVEADAIAELAETSRLGAVEIPAPVDRSFAMLATLAEVARTGATDEVLLRLDPGPWLAANPDSGIGGLIEMVMLVQEHVALLSTIDLNVADDAALGRRLGEAFAAWTDSKAKDWLHRVRSAAGAPSEPLRAYFRACQRGYVARERAALARPIS